MQIDELQKVVPYRKVFPDGYTVDVKRIGSQTYFKIRREGTIQTQLSFQLAVSEAKRRKP